jgi:hypothetical protein
MSPVTCLGLLCLDPKGIERRKDRDFNLILRATWIDVPLDLDGFLMLLSFVSEMLSWASPPSPDPGCEWCGADAAAA